jgi:hypothetical protein
MRLICWWFISTAGTFNNTLHDKLVFQAVESESRVKWNEAGISEGSVCFEV